MPGSPPATPVEGTGCGRAPLETRHLLHTSAWEFVVRRYLRVAAVTYVGFDPIGQPMTPLTEVHARMFPVSPSYPTGTRRNPVGARRRRVVVAAGLALGTALLSACSGGSTTPPAANDSSGAASGECKQGGTLRLTLSDASASDSFDPVTLLNANGFTLSNSVFDQLTTFGEDFAAEPALAASWKPSADAKSWTIKLREGVTWHDGSPFTSKDVVYTMKRWLDEETGGSMYGFISPVLTPEGISAPDDHTVVLELTKPQGTLMQTFAALPYASIVKDGTTDFSKTAVGTGPYKVGEFTPGQGWKLLRNEEYWGGAPSVDALQATIVPDPSAKVQAALSGSADLTDLIPSTLWGTLEGKESAKLVPAENYNSFWFTFDQSQEPFDDPKVIQALKLGTDRESILQTALQGAGEVLADVPVDPSTSWYPSDVEPEYDVEKAKALLAEAGYPNGFDMELATNTAVPGQTDVAVAWQESMKDIGVNVTLNQLPGDSYYTKGWGVAPAFMDYATNAFPPILLNAFYVEGAPYQMSKFTLPEVTDLTNQLNASTDLTTQQELNKKAFTAARDAYSYLVPVFADGAYATAPNVNGVEVISAGLFDLRKVCLS